MTNYDPACSQLSYWLELHGPTENPRSVIQSIVHEVAPKRRLSRNQLEDKLYEHWIMLTEEDINAG